MDVLTTLTQAVATTALAVIAFLVSGGLIWAIALLRSKVSAQTLETISDIADAAVKAAEQDPLVQNKKQAALEFATDLLNQLGIEVTPEVLEATIEKAVMEAFNYDYEANDVKVGFAKKSADQDADILAF